MIFNKISGQYVVPFVNAAELVASTLERMLQWTGNGNIVSKAVTVGTAIYSEEDYEDLLEYDTEEFYYDSVVKSVELADAKVEQLAKNRLRITVKETVMVVEVTEWGVCAALSGFMEKVVKSFSKGWHNQPYEDEKNLANCFSEVGVIVRQNIGEHPTDTTGFFIAHEMLGNKAACWSDWAMSAVGLDLPGEAGEFLIACLTSVGGNSFTQEYWEKLGKTPPTDEEIRHWNGFYEKWVISHEGRPIISFMKDGGVVMSYDITPCPLWNAMDIEKIREKFGFGAEPIPKTFNFQQRYYPSAGVPGNGGKGTTIGISPMEVAISFVQTISSWGSGHWGDIYLSPDDCQGEHKLFSIGNQEFGTAKQVADKLKW